jgi:hypothetical protein
VAKVTEKITFHVSGGVAPYSISAQDQINPNPQPGTPIAVPDITVLAAGAGDSFTVTAKSTGSPAALTGASMITVTSSDGQKKNIVLTVYPNP